jgi:hypothetical protein
MADEGEQPRDNQGGDQNKQDLKSFEELRAAFDTLEKEIRNNFPKPANAPQTGPALSNWDRFNQFTSSGLFFMIIGTAFLTVAATTLNTAHASFSFVLVVIGVAVVLFGTGTQGVGQAQATGYKVAIAGGAGVIAFCVGWGIVRYADEIKTVFQVEKKYVRVTLVGGDGVSNMSAYMAAFSVDGVAVPSAKHDDFVEVFIPYFASDWKKGPIVATSLAESTTQLFRGCPTAAANTPDASASKNSTAAKPNEDEFVIKTMRAAFYRIDAKDNLREKLQDLVTVRLRKSAIGSGYSGLDFPLYPDTVCVYLVSQQKTQSDLQKTSQAADVRPANAKPIEAGPGPLLPTD